MWRRPGWTWKRMQSSSEELSPCASRVWTVSWGQGLVELLEGDGEQEVLGFLSLLVLLAHGAPTTMLGCSLSHLRPHPGKLLLACPTSRSCFYSSFGRCRTRLGTLLGLSHLSTHVPWAWP